MRKKRNLGNMQNRPIERGLDRHKSSGGVFVQLEKQPCSRCGHRIYDPTFWMIDGVMKPLCEGCELRFLRDAVTHFAPK